MSRRTDFFAPLVLLVCAIVFSLTVMALRHHVRKQAASEIEVALPLFVQVFMAGGDRFLAANLGNVRALIADTARMQPDQYTVLAKVQVDASWLNPAHEDNYYIAAAILPWNGQVDAAQTVLRRASIARPFDYQPSFLYAFNLLQFKGDAAAASAWLRNAATKLPDDDERLLMENFAARWMDRTDDLELAAAVVDSMAKQARRKDFRAYLQQRAQRLRDLLALRKAAAAFAAHTGAAPRTLDQLVSGGFIAVLPVDPFGFGYALDAEGNPVFNVQARR